MTQVKNRRRHRESTENVITYPEALQWLFALSLSPLRAPSPLPLGEEREQSRRPERRRRAAALGEW